jgi:hypothetical protein
MENGIVLAGKRMYKRDYPVFQSHIQLRMHQSFRGRYNLQNRGSTPLETLKEKFLSKGGWYCCALNASGIQVGMKFMPITEGRRYGAIINFDTEEVMVVTVEHSNEDLLSKGWRRLPVEIKSAEDFVVFLNAE